MNKKGFLNISIALVILITLSMILYNGGLILSRTVDIGAKEDKIINTYWEAEQLRQYVADAATLHLYETMYQSGVTPSSNCFEGMQTSGVSSIMPGFYNDFELLENQELELNPQYFLELNPQNNVWYISVGERGSTPSYKTKIIDNEYNFNYSFRTRTKFKASCTEYMRFYNTKLS